MVHQGQGLTFRLKATDNLLGVHTELDQFKRNLAGHRLRLFGQPYFTHSTLAQKLDKTVGSDVRWVGDNSITGQALPAIPGCELDEKETLCALYSLQCTHAQVADGEAWALFELLLHDLGHDDLTGSGLTLDASCQVDSIPVDISVLPPGDLTQVAANTESHTVSPNFLVCRELVLQGQRGVESSVNAVEHG
jgi:hypothetical protein